MLMLQTAHPLSNAEIKKLTTNINKERHQAEIDIQIQAPNNDNVNSCQNEH